MTNVHLEWFPLTGDDIRFLVYENRFYWRMRDLRQITFVNNLSSYADRLGKTEMTWFLVDYPNGSQQTRFVSTDELRTIGKMIPANPYIAPFLAWAESYIAPSAASGERVPTPEPVYSTRPLNWVSPDETDICSPGVYWLYFHEKRTLKVGRTSNLKPRLQTYTHFGKYDGQVCHVDNEIDRRNIEKTMINLAWHVSPTNHGREWFDAESYGQCRHLFQNTPFWQLTDDAKSFYRVA
jgi:hypothetical protein